MPCNTVTMQSLSIGLANAIPAVLAQALKEAGYKLYEETDALIRGSDRDSTFVWNKGTGLVVRSQNPTATKGVIMQAYSKAAVSWAAQRAGFKQVGLWQDNKVTLQRG